MSTDFQLKTPTRGSLIAVLAVCGLAATSLWLRAGFPLYAIGPNNNDDFLFIRLAGALRRGHWLGAYDNLTLAKGMFYPLFIAVVSVPHIPLKIAEQLLYLAAAAGFSLVVYRLSRNRWLGVLLFALLAFNPVVWTSNLARVLRDGIYISLSLGLVAAIAALCSHQFAAGRSVRQKVIVAVSTGVLGAAYWLTREEGIWIIPALLTVGGFAGASLSIDRGLSVESKKRTVRDSAGALAIAAVAAIGVVTTVALLNLAVYGVFCDVEFRAGGFQSAYGALARVKYDDWRRYVIVPHAVREKVYAVSEAAAELRPSLEGDQGTNWRLNGCVQQHIDPCPDILAGWFVWALRDAVASAGHYRTAPEAEAFYRRVANDINGACTDGRLDCLPPRVGLSPPLREQYIGDAAATSLQMVPVLLRFGEELVKSPMSQGSPQQLAIFRALAGPIEVDNENMIIEDFFGWVAGPHGPPTVAVLDDQGNKRGRVDLLPAPDVDQALQGRGLFGRRFTISPDCPKFDCVFQITTADGIVRRLPLASLKRVPARDPAYTLHIEDMDLVNVTDGAETKRAAAPVQRIARGIAHVYALLAPPLCASACLGLLIALWAFRRDATTLFLTGIGVAAVTAIVTRVALCSYLEVTSFPALNILYLSSATPFVIVAVVMGNWLGVRVLILLGTTAVGKRY